MSNFGIKVGSDVDNNTDKELELTSKYSSLKVYKWATTSFTTNGSGTGSVEITHDLGYTPITIVYNKFTAQYTFLSATTYANSFCQVGKFYNEYNPVNPAFQFSTDDTTLTISTIPPIGGLGTSASPNTTYYFRYYIMVDLSQEFSDASNIELTDDMGFKVSKPGKNVLTDDEYDMAMSSKYKSLQYYDNHVLTSSLTLPAMWASRNDDEAEEATYVDFNHNLGYQPMFLAFTDFPAQEGLPSGVYELPSGELFQSGLTITGQTEISSWCDSSRVRVMFRRWSKTPSGSSYGKIFSAKTINVYVIILAEDLTGEDS